MAAWLQGNALKKEQAKVWRVRHISVIKTLFKDVGLDTRRLLYILQKKTLNFGGTAELNSQYDDDDLDSNDSFYKTCQADLETISSIYLDDHRLMEPLELVSRALTDSHFSQFLLKLPSIFNHYGSKRAK